MLLMTWGGVIITCTTTAVLLLFLLSFAISMFVDKVSLPAFSFSEV